MNVCAPARLEAPPGASAEQAELLRTEQLLETIRRRMDEENQARKEEVKQENQEMEIKVEQEENQQQNRPMSDGKEEEQQLEIRVKLENLEMEVGGMEENREENQEEKKQENREMEVGGMEENREENEEEKKQENRAENPQENQNQAAASSGQQVNTPSETPPPKRARRSAGATASRTQTAKKKPTADPKTRPLCPLCHKPIGAMRRHLRYTHSVANAQERLILLKLAAGRICIRTRPCPVPGCGYAGPRLDSHLRQSHPELPAAQTQRHAQQLKHRVALELLGRLRASSPSPPLISTLDLPDPDPPPPQTPPPSACAACRRWSEEARRAKEELAQLRAAYGVLSLQHLQLRTKYATKLRTLAEELEEEGETPSSGCSAAGPKGGAGEPGEASAAGGEASAAGGEASAASRCSRRTRLTRHGAFSSVSQFDQRFSSVTSSKLKDTEEQKKKRRKTAVVLLRDFKKHF